MTNKNGAKKVIVLMYGFRSVVGMRCNFAT